TLLERISDVARQTNLPVTVIDRDQMPRCGPLSGVLTAFDLISASTILFLSCDMPFVSVGLLEKVLRSAAENSACFVRTPVGFGFPFALKSSTRSTVKGLV